MAKNSKLVLAFAAGILIMAFCFYYVIPAFTPQGTSPPPTYPLTLQFKTNVSHEYNETYSTTNFAAGILYIYNMQWNLIESITYSSGFTSAHYYTSGEQVRFKLTATGIQTVSGTFTMPFYPSDANAAGYHILASIPIVYSPTLVCTYSVNGAYNTSAKTTYTVAVSGNTLTVTMEVYNTKDESGLRNWNDGTYQYNPLVEVDNFYYNASAKPLLIHITGLECVRVETASTTGIYIARPAEHCVDRNKNQASGNLIVNNRLTVSFSIDISQITSTNVAAIRLVLYDSVDYNYFHTYAAGQTGAETLLSPGALSYTFYIKAS